MILSGCAVPVPPDGAGTGQSIPDDLVINIRQLTSEVDPSELGAAVGDPVIQFKGISEVEVNTGALPPGTRHFLLGTVPIGAPSPAITDQALEEAIAFAGGTAECYVIRQKVDWEAFRPGGIAEPDFTQSIFDLLAAAEQSGFTASLVELDPIVDRHNVGPLPPAIEDQNFGSPDVREALRRQVIEVARGARPDYMSFAVEANGYFESNPDDFMNFVSLHKELYHEVKAISPETQVMVSFNLEAIQGLLSSLGGFSDHGPQWFLLDMFEPELDAVAFSTLPFPVYYEPLQIPDDYLSRIQEHTDRPIVLSEVGWTSYEGAGSDEEKQAEYLSLMTRQALRTPQLRVFAWTILFDAAEGSIFDLFPDFKFLGLLTADAMPKPAFTVYADLYFRTLVYDTP